MALKSHINFILIILYMIITYHIIALKYEKSRFFSDFNNKLKISLVGLHVFIVITNILLYFFLISDDFNPIYYIFEGIGILIFAAGVFIIFWSMYYLKKEVFVPENELIVNGPFSFVRHPMYFGGIIGAFGLAIFAGSFLGILYTIALTVVLSRIADYEEEDLKVRIGQEYIEYSKNVPKLFPYVCF